MTVPPDAPVPDPPVPDRPALAEDLLLLLLDSRSGTFAGEGMPLFHVLAGGVLVDLAVQERLVIADRSTWRGRLVEATGDAPGDPLLPPPATATLVSPTAVPAAVPDITRPSPRRSLTLGGPLATPGAMAPPPQDAAQSAPDITAPAPPPTTVATAAQAASPAPDTSAAPRSSIKLNGADDDGVMTFEQLPESIRARIPRFDVQVHVWNTDPTKRWALIDGKRMTDGSSISSDVKLQEITPDGLLLNVDGQKVLFSR